MGIVTSLNLSLMLFYCVTNAHVFLDWFVNDNLILLPIDCIEELSNFHTELSMRKELGSITLNVQSFEVFEFLYCSAKALRSQRL